MEAGISTLSIIPIRVEPSHQSELVTQILFGEMYDILEKQGNWFKISTKFDNYVGFLSTDQHTAISQKTFKDLENSDKSIVLDLVHSITGNNKKFPVSIGSILYDFDGVNCRVGNEKFHFSGKSISTATLQPSAEVICKTAIKFLDAPYLWGGRSPFGIDCSGFVQIVYKACGIHLPRDAWQQGDTGKTLHFVHETRPGDLAFFANDEGSLVHVGILLDSERIIHASGQVRLDSIDHYGIYNKTLKKYTHKLRILKRLL